jgi:uncharacterized protein (DUF362 family)
MAQSKVAILRTSPETILDDYGRLLELADVSSYLAPGRQTILKDNLSWHLYFPSANTTPWQLEGTMRGLQANGYNDLVTVHNNTVVTDPFRGGELNRLGPIYRHYDIPEIFNFRPEDVRWIQYQPKARMKVLNKVYPKGIHIPDFFKDKNIVHLPTVKTHIYTTTTGAMKNAFGGLLNTRRHYTHSWIHDTLVDLLAIQKEIHSGIFAVMDGTTAGSGPGPRTLIPHDKNVILASGDQVAIDAVAAYLMGFDPMDIRYIRLAHEDGLGIGKIEDIEVVGDLDVLKERWNFTVGDNLASLVGDAFWFGPFKALQKLTFHTPLVYIFVFGSYLYHDFIWYPMKGKSVVKRFLQDSPWGRLFERYGREEFLAPQTAASEQSTT